MTRIRVLGVQRPHPTLGVPGILPMLIPRPLDKIALPSILLSRLMAIVLGSKTIGRLESRLTTADLILIRAGLLLKTLVTCFLKLRQIRRVAAGSGPLEEPVEGLITGMFVDLTSPSAVPPRGT